MQFCHCPNLGGIEGRVSSTFVDKLGVMEWWGGSLEEIQVTTIRTNGNKYCVSKNIKCKWNMGEKIISEGGSFHLKINMYKIIRRLWLVQIETNMVLLHGKILTFNVSVL